MSVLCFVRVLEVTVDGDLPAFASEAELSRARTAYDAASVSLRRLSSTILAMLLASFLTVVAALYGPICWVLNLTLCVTNLTAEFDEQRQIYEKSAEMP